MRRFWFIVGMCVLPVIGVLFWALARREYHAAGILLDFGPDVLAKAQAAQAVIDAGSLTGTGYCYEVNMS